MNNFLSRDGVARARAARGDLRSAIEIYRKLITPDISSKFTGFLEPREVLALARLLERAGDRAGAREQYRRLAEMWRHADPAAPDLAEVRNKAGG